MLQTARYIHFKLRGVFPGTYEELVNLKGVGPYTAAAIASFAYDETRAVVDGNVVRVLSRFFGIETPYPGSQGKKEFQELADRLIDSSQPGTFNQAIMDFGATQCTPAKPDCKSCPFSGQCIAWQSDQVQQFPVKKKKSPRKERYFLYLVFQSGSSFILQKRVQNDIWKGLFEFPMLEVSKDQYLQPALPDPAVFFKDSLPPEVLHLSNTVESHQLLSHQKIHARFYHVAGTHPASLTKNNNLVDYENLCNFAFPKIIDWYIVEKLIPL